MLEWIAIFCCAALLLILVIVLGSIVRVLRDISVQLARLIDKFKLEIQLKPDYSEIEFMQ